MMRCSVLYRITLLALLTLRPSHAQCGRSCSGHGLCNSNAQCVCFPGWTGADCSSKTCPVGRAWTARPLFFDSGAAYSSIGVGGNFTSTNGVTTHGQLVECSAAGVCDRATGTCTCMSNAFTGDACQKTRCPGDCSGSGSCIDMATLARTYGAPGATSYTNWEAPSQQGCVCNWGYTDPACSSVLCPFADNPTTMNQQRYSVRIVADMSSVLTSPSRGLQLTFDAFSSIILPLASIPSSAACLTWLATLTNVAASESSCWVTAGPAASPVDGTLIAASSVEIVLALSFPVDNAMNNLFVHSGSPAISKFTCAVTATAASGATSSSFSACVVTRVDVLTATLVSTLAVPTATYYIAVANAGSTPNTVSVTRSVGTPPITVTFAAVGMTYNAAGVDVGDGTKLFFAAAVGHTRDAQWVLTSSGFVSPTYIEHEACAGVGVCNLATGNCACPVGFSGLACDKAANYITQNPLELTPVLSLIATPQMYNSTVLQITSVRPQSTAFNYITVSDSISAPFFTLRGDGTLLTRGITADSGTRIIMSDSFAQLTPSTPALQVAWTTPAIAPTSAVMQVSSEIPVDGSGVVASSSYSLFQVLAKTTASGVGYTSLLSVQGDGQLQLSRGGLFVRDRMTSPTVTVTVAPTTGASGIGISASGTYSNNFDGVAVTGPSTGTYNFLRFAYPRASSGGNFTINQGGDIVSTDDLYISTSAASGSGSTPNLLLQTGAAVGATGGSISISTGAGSTGSHVDIRSGASTTQGNVNIQIGTGGASKLTLSDGAGIARVAIANDGSTTFNGRSVLALMGSNNYFTGFAGGSVSIAGGTGDNLQVGGNVFIQPGFGTFNSHGDVMIRDVNGVNRIASTGSGSTVTVSPTLATVLTTSAPVSTGAVSIIGSLRTTNAASSPTMSLNTHLSYAAMEAVVTGGSFTDVGILTGPSTGTYNVLRMGRSSGPSLTVNQDADITSTDSLSVATAVGSGIVLTSGAAAGASSGAISIVTGGCGLCSSSANVEIRGGDANGQAGSVILQAGATTGGSAAANGVVAMKDAAGKARVTVAGDGGVISLTAQTTVVMQGGSGVGSSVNGGSVSLVGGIGDAGLIGGDVLLQAGGGTIAGAVRLRDKLGATRVLSTGDGSIVSLSASSGIVLQGDSGVAASTAGGSISLVGGTGAASSSGGNVVLRAGTSAGTKGSIQLQDAGSVRRLDVGSTQAALYSDSAAPYAAFTHGATPSGSSIGLAGAVSIGGSLTVASGFAKAAVQFVTSSTTINTGHPADAATSSVRMAFNAAGASITVAYGASPVYASGVTNVVVPAGTMFPLYS